MDKKILKNLIYNTSYQILTLLLPFITIPYVSRIFSPKELGVYSSTFADVSMFCIIGMFAMSSYGTRCIAQVRENRLEVSKKFKELRFIQVCTVSIIIIIYFYIFIVLNKNYRLIYLIQGINLLAYLVDISWLFMGIEDFKKTVTRNAIVKVSSIIAIFLLVKDSSDLNLYILIMAVGMFLGNLVMWIYKKNIVDNVEIKKYRVKENIKEAFFLFLPIMFFQIYTSFDRSILASVSTFEEVGMFDQSQKIIRMTVGIVTSLGIVILPRIASMVSKNNKKEEINVLLKKSLNLTLFISCGAASGLMALSKNFIPWFYGDEYLNVYVLINITSIVCILTALGSFFSNQYAIPADKKKAYIIPIGVAAVISLILNLILGKTLGSIGAAITIVIVESIALILRIFLLRKDLDIKFLFEGTYKFFISGIVMYLGIKNVSIIFNLKGTVSSTIIEFIIGILIYLILNFIFNRKLIKNFAEKYIVN